MFNIIIPIICICVYGAIRVEEVNQERNWKKCEETDWNEFYANI